ncbi:MAG: flagellar protein FliT [Selenomonadaceae bacterium]|nr:flagellar protein FliT [Selenomonadaceae bacterium]
MTKELLKFIKAEDIDMFLQLVDQRQALMEMMQEVPLAERDFSGTAECQAMREAIKPMDMQIMYKARAWLNKSRRNNQTVRGYDVAGYGAASYGAAGNVFNRQL